ncbi:copper resistance CopC family protein [Dermacoccaceae bacterium W4C1]
MRAHLRLLAPVLALMTILLGIGIPRASAHDRLVSSDPADGSTVQQLDAVTLTFNESVLGTGARMSIAGPDGTSTGAASVADTKVTRDLDSTTPGRYTVTWRVTSSDGHPISGEFSFTLAGSSTSAAASTSAGTASGTATGSAAATTSGGWLAGQGQSTSAGSSSATTSPSTTIGTDDTAKRPWLVGGLALAAVVAIGVGAVFARGRLRDDD